MPEKSQKVVANFREASIKCLLCGKKTYVDRPLSDTDFARRIETFKLECKTCPNRPPDGEV